ncbi:MAG: hypothetical protein LBM77_01070 [Spirochaetaceae bacterium]|jgi:translation initiation factor IF-2|nr:hypothetical protein [Spirochaetaceae bacterium]
MESKTTSEAISQALQNNAMPKLRLILKTDTTGTAEALKASLEALSSAEILVQVIQATLGIINKSDIDMAVAAQALVIGFNVKIDPRAKQLAKQEKIDIKLYNVIYKVVDDIKAIIKGSVQPKLEEKETGTAEVRNIFKVPKVGAVAGCYVLTGTVSQTAIAHVIRKGEEIYKGKIGSLKRLKDDVRSVAQGYECGIGIEGFDEIKVGDEIRFTEMR